MVTVQTFLRAPDGTFRLVEESTEAPTDADYIEGAIELRIDGTELLGLAEPDYVDQLWSYLVDMIDTLKTEDAADTYLPDQPIRLAFARKAGDILVTCEIGDVVRQAGAAEADLLAALRIAGQRFFERMSDLVEENSTDYQLTLAALRE